MILLNLEKKRNCITAIIIPFFDVPYIKKNIYTSIPFEHPPDQGETLSEHLGGSIGCKDKTSSRGLIGFPCGSSIASTI